MIHKRKAKISASFLQTPRNYLLLVTWQTKNANSDQNTWNFVSKRSKQWFEDEKKVFCHKKSTQKSKILNFVGRDRIFSIPEISLLFPCSVLTNQRGSADFLAQSPSKQRLALTIFAQSDLTSIFDPTDSKSISAQSQRRQKETPRKKVKHFSHPKHMKIFQRNQKN